MSRAALTLDRPEQRRKAAHWCMTAPFGTRVTFQEAKRTTDQNSALWLLLTAVASHVKWHGQRLSPEDWKILFLASLNTEMRIVPNLDGTGFVPLGRSSSKLSISEMRDLIELIIAFGAQHDLNLFDSAKGGGEPNKLPAEAVLQLADQREVA